LASQHPLGQLLGVQVHLPCGLQSWVAWHVVQTAPPVPQWSSFDVSHLPLAQQPEQETPPQLHVPFVQACPIAQLPHALPAEPHASAVCLSRGTHWFCRQQPFGQETAVHSHAPELPQT